ncbi:MAG: hypothetical protein JO264_06140 [Acidisphaera sp.]|nr:hypothetical protein [Acidisphaera sp.]
MPPSDDLDLKIELSDARGDAKLAAAIGRSDTKFAELIGRMDAGFASLRGELQAKLSTIEARLDGVEKATAGIKTTIIVTVLPTGLAVIAAVIGILAYGQAWFGIGVSTRDIIRTTVAEYQQGHPQPAPAPSPH